MNEWLKLIWMLSEYFGAPAVATAAGVSKDRVLAWKARGWAIVQQREPRPIYLKKPNPTAEQVERMCAFAQRATEDMHYQVAIVRMRSTDAE